MNFTQLLEQVKPLARSMAVGVEYFDSETFDAVIDEEIAEMAEQFQTQDPNQVWSEIVDNIPSNVWSNIVQMTQVHGDSDKMTEGYTQLMQQIAQSDGQEFDATRTANALSSMFQNTDTMNQMMQIGAQVEQLVNPEHTGTLQSQILWADQLTPLAERFNLPSAVLFYRMHRLADKIDTSELNAMSDDERVEYGIQYLRQPVVAEEQEVECNLPPEPQIMQDIWYKFNQFRKRMTAPPPIPELSAQMI